MISYRKLAMRVLGHSPVSAVKTARRSTGKRAAALALTAALVVGMTLPAFAGTWYIEDGDISISAGTSGNNVTQEGGRTKENDTDTVITNRKSTASSNTVTIDAGEGKTVDVTLKDVNIDASSGAAVSVTGKGDTNIELDGNNTLKSNYHYAGLEHNKETDSEGNETSGTLTITDTDKNGSLTATGSNGGAGIGGQNTENAGKIEITGGTITAIGSEDGAGIGGGGGNGGSGGDADITISGGTITAIGGQSEQIGGAGIGGGGYGGSADITITGDAVIKEAIGGNGSAGIGSGMGNPWTKPEPLITVGNVTIEGNAKVDKAVGGANGAAGIGGGTFGIGKVTIRGNAQIGTATGGDEGAGIGGGVYGTGDVTIEGNVTIKNAKGGAGAAGIGGGAETQPDTEDTRNKVSIKSTDDGFPTINATGGRAYEDRYVSLPGAAAIGSGSVAAGATEVKSDITIEGKVIINATSGGDVAIGDSTGETRFSGLQVGTTIKRTDSNGKDVTQPGDVVREQVPAETETAEAPSTGSVEVERPVTVEGLYVTNVLGKQITHTCTQNGTTLTIRANGIVASAHLTLGMVRTLKAQGVKTLVFTTLLSRSTTVSVDALLAADPDAPDETAVVWTHTGVRTALTIGGADHSALLK